MGSSSTGLQFGLTFRNVSPNCKPVLLEPKSEEHTSELQSQSNLVCRLLLEKKKHREVASAIVTRNRTPHDVNVFDTAAPELHRLSEPCYFPLPLLTMMPRHTHLQIIRRTGD